MFFLSGEKLSKQQLQHSNIIKKLRVKEKENDATITKQSKKLKEQEDELQQLQQVNIFLFRDLFGAKTRRHYVVTI